MSKDHASQSSSATKIQLSPEQERVVHTWGQGLAVMAGAGAGKTSTLVQKCSALLARNPDARFAAVSFTEKSAADLREKLSRVLKLEKHWVMTIHGLCGQILRDFPRQAGFQGDERVLDQTDAKLMWERAIDGVWFEEIPNEVEGALERLLARENRSELERLLERLRELKLQGAIEALENSDDPDSRSLTLLARFVIERYERSKKRMGAIDFSDLEKAADRALEAREVREAYHSRFDLVMVDEFQDTNPLQARILWRFTKPDQSNLVVVGDPKQSIYRFRDADVTTFEECCARLPVNASLTWNFRSRPAIIDWINQACEPTFQASNLRYDPLIPKRESRDDLDPVLRLKEATPERLAEWINAEAKKEGSGGYGAMALLLRKIRGREEWLKGLSQSGVPIAVGSGGLFWEDPRVRECVSFLKWWSNPKHSLSGGVFLRAPWMGINDLTLDQWVREDLTWVSPFFGSDHPVAKALNPYREKSPRPGELLLALLIDDEREAELSAPILGLWHRAEELSERGLDFHAAVRELARAVSEKKRERDLPPPDRINSPDAALGQLRVLTLHGSKGLEFDRVLLLDFEEKEKRQPNAPLLFWDRKAGAFLGRRDEDGERDREHSEEIRFREVENQNALSESKRLYYVALTRAREQLVLITPEPKTDAPPKVKPGSPYLKDFWWGWILESGARPKEQALVSSGFKPKLELEKPKGLRPKLFSDFYSDTIGFARSRHSVTEWLRLLRCQKEYAFGVLDAEFDSVPDLSASTESEFAQASKLEGDLESEKQNPFEEVSQSSLKHGQGLGKDPMGKPVFDPRAFGIRVHALMEKWRGNSRAMVDAWERDEAFNGALPLNRDALLTWLENRPEAQVYRELPFEVKIGSEVLVGAVDRLEVRGKEGSDFTVIDFKVLQSESRISGIEERYRTQLELYALAAVLVSGPQSKKFTGTLRASLLALTPETVKEIPVLLPSVARLMENAKRTADLSKQLLKNPSDASANPSLKNCRSCAYLPRCSEGQTELRGQRELRG